MLKWCPGLMRWDLLHSGPYEDTRSVYLHGDHVSGILFTWVGRHQGVPLHAFLNFNHQMFIPDAGISMKSEKITSASRRRAWSVTAQWCFRNKNKKISLNGMLLAYCYLAAICAITFFFLSTTLGPNLIVTRNYYSSHDMIDFDKASITTSVLNDNCDGSFK